VIPTITPYLKVGAFYIACNRDVSPVDLGQSIPGESCRFQRAAPDKFATPATRAGFRQSIPPHRDVGYCKGISRSTRLVRR
jgi:hypothetical protein